MLEQISFNLWYYKLQKKYRLLTKMRKIKSKSYIQSLPWRVSCFGSSKLSLSLSRWCIRLNSKECAQGSNSCAYIGILPSRMHLLAITTHYWLLQFISGHYHPLTAIQFGFQNWRALQIFKMLGPNYYILPLGPNILT